MSVIIDSESTFVSTDKSILLRKLTSNMVSQRYVDWLNDEIINQYMETRFSSHTLVNVKEFVESKLKSEVEYLFAIFDNERDVHIGNCKIGPIDWNHKRGWVSLFVGEKDYWGKGLGRKIIQMLINISFETLGLHKIIAGSYGSNLSSIKSFQSMGFSIEGRQKEYFILNGKYDDCVLLGLTRERL